MLFTQFLKLCGCVRACGCACICVQGCPQKIKVERCQRRAHEQCTYLIKGHVGSPTKINMYSTPRRSLCVCPDAGCVWTIFPPTHCTHKYLASVHHRALASASASVRLRLCPCICVRASASASVLLHVRPPVCVSIRASACPSARLCVRPCVCRSGHAGRASAGPVQIYIIM